MKMIYESGTGEVVEKKSRFIANVFQVMNEEQAVSYINNMKKQYYDARHNCSAYVCGDHNEIQKFFDDGEPSGTAGKPIMDIIISQELHNCLIVVTRYFGGTLLGTGGLLRAYQAASKAGLENAKIVEVIDGIMALIDIDYNHVGKVQYICADMGINIYKSEYAENVHMEVLMEKDIYMEFSHKLTESFSGNVNISETFDQKFCKSTENEIILMKNCE